MISETGENLVFIFSLPRSGSTLLGAILGNHSQVHCPAEPWILLRLFDVYGEPAEGRIFDDYVASKAVKSLLSKDEFVASARLFASAAYNGILARTNNSILVDKTPRYYHILDFIQELFPQAKKIWLKRNPLDVAASYKINWHRGVDFLTGETLDPASFDFLLGLPSFQKFFDEKSPEKFEIKYEDLVNSPEQEIRRLTDFCGIAFEGSMLDVNKSSKGLMALSGSELGDQKIKAGSQIHGNSIGGWQKHLDSNEIKRLTSLLGSNIFIRMGYEQVVKDHGEFFAPDIGEDVLAKARAMILEKSQVMKTVQMAVIYENESKLRWYEKDRQEKSTLLQQLEQQLGATQGKIAELENLRGKLSESIAHLEAQLRSIETGKQDLEQRLKSAAEDRTELENLRGKLSESIAHLEAQLRSIETEKQDLEQRLQSAAEDRVERVGWLSNLQKHVATLEDDLEKKDRAYQEQITRMQLDIQEQEAQYRAMKSSYSYRVGRILFFPFSKLRNWVRKLDVK